MQAKDTSARSRGAGGGAALEAAERNATGCSALRVQPCPLPPRRLLLAEDPPAPATATARSGASPGLRRPPRKVARHRPALRMTERGPSGVESSTR